MERRAYLKNTALLLGITVSSTAISNFLISCNQPKSNNNLSFFNEDEFELISNISNTILPKTKTPGALEVGVPDFIDKFIFHCFDDNGKKEMKSGLKEFNDKCEKDFGKNFKSLSDDEKHQCLMKHQEVAPKSGMSLWGINLEPNAAKPTFYKQIKSLTLFGYFTSETIGKEYLDYQPIPGEFLACLPVGESKISFE